MIGIKKLELWKRQGDALKDFFGLPADVDSILLYRKLLMIENSMSRVSTQYCNGYVSEEKVRKEEVKTLEKLKKLGLDISKIEINLDPRGYALKIKDTLSRDFYRRDFGGYGIIAPEL